MTPLWMKLYELDLIPHKKKELEKQELFITLILKNVSFWVSKV